MTERNTGKSNKISFFTVIGQYTEEDEILTDIVKAETIDAAMIDVINKRQDSGVAYKVYGAFPGKHSPVLLQQKDTIH